VEQSIREFLTIDYSHSAIGKNGVDESVPHRFDGGDLCEECYAKAMSDEEEEEE
jgi:hypothetical protein